MTEQGKPLTEAFIRALYTQGPDALVFNLAERGMIEPEVEPDLVEAREIAARVCEDHGAPEVAKFVRGCSPSKSTTLDAALTALRRGKELGQAAARPLTREQEREVLWRAYDAVRGTNADMCRSASQAYRLCCAAVKDLYDTALTQQMEGRDG